MRQAQPIGVAESEVSIMLWPNAQRQLSSSLIIPALSVSVSVVVCRVAAGNRFKVLLYEVGHTGVNRGTAGVATPLAHVNGELLNENKIVTGSNKGSARLSIEGHNPEKNGIYSGWVATEAITTGGASLIRKLPPQRRQYLPENWN